jgi:hypothetical protein
LDGCKEGLPALQSSNDDADDEGQDHQRGVHMSDHVSISGVDCGGASGNHDSNLAECFGRGNKELQADNKCNMKDVLVDYEVDPYKEALQDLPYGGGDIFFRS